MNVPVGSEFVDANEAVASNRPASTTPVLSATIDALLTPGKGILAADESLQNISRQFAALGVPSTAQNRRDYHEMLFATPELDRRISGIILFDETLNQVSAEGTPMVRFLEQRGLVPGIKVDQGTVALAGFLGEKITEGLDGLRERLVTYRGCGARFTKWRAVLSVDDHLPTPACVATNADALASFAALSQEAGLVPIVEPEVTLDGSHTLTRCEEVTTAVLRRVFTALNDRHVALELMLLKTGMVLSGRACPEQAGHDQVAQATLRCLRRSVPAAVPGIVFLSGGQGDVAATQRLSAICHDAQVPWRLTFSFGRALQAAAMGCWKGSPENRVTVQQALFHRAQCNGLATEGRYSATADWAGC